ncbi:MAG TPA: glycogen debranching enzyme GlgX, partial [Nocardioides sp.]|nr:glycogen debranching enzyme GlgX [Nocardioides sp.]
MSPVLWQSLGERAPVWPGNYFPLGATWSPESTNFAVHAPNATEVWLCTFDDEGGEQRHQLTEQTLGIWHGAIPDIAPGTLYGFRADGPWDPEQGLRFNPRKLLLDPYGLAVSGSIAPGEDLLGYRVDDPDQPSTSDSAASTARSVVVAPLFDWEGDTPMRRRWRDTVVYELHVKGFTQVNERIPEELRG